MPELTPRRQPGAAAGSAPSAAELQAAHELMRNLEELAPESLDVTDPQAALPELARALELRAKQR